MCVYLKQNKGFVSASEISQQPTTRYSMVYMENDACPEKKDFLRGVEKDQNLATVSINH